MAGGQRAADYDATMRDLVLMTLVSLPFLLVAGGLIAFGTFAKGGWEGLSWAIYGAVVAGVWGVLILGWCGWIVLRDGWQWSSLLPAAVLFLVFVLAAAWGGRTWLEQHRCNRATAFFVSFAAADVAGRTAQIEQGRHHILAPGWCGLEQIGYLLGLDHQGHPVAPGGDADRLSALRMLLDAGLPPADSLLFGAARDGDRDALRLFTAQRQTINAAAVAPQWEVFPLRPAHAALRQLLNQGRQGDQTEAASRYRDVLQDFVAGGVDLCTPTETGIPLSQEMTRAGLPWQDWRAAADSDCDPAGQVPRR